MSSVAIARVREGITTILSSLDESSPLGLSPTRGPSSPQRSSSEPTSPVSSSDGGKMSNSSSIAYELQKEVNKVRVLFPTTPADLVQKHRRLTSLFHEFASLASQIVEERMMKLLLSGCLRRVDAFRSLMGLPPWSPDASSAIDEKTMPQLPQELQDMKFIDLDSFSCDGICFYLMTEPGTVIANSVAINARLPKELDAVASFERARKLAHKEVKMRSHLLSIAHMESLLQLPLCAAIDFAGFTFFAEVDINLTTKSLIGGIGTPQLSHQFSRRVIRGEAVAPLRAAEHLSRAIGLTCRLRGHNGGGNTTFLPQDMQIHLGHDGMYYAMCTRRLLPPVICGPGGEPPPESSGSKNAHIVQSPTVRFLPEFLERFCENTALNPDAWFDDDARQLDSSDYDVLNYSGTLHKRAIAQAVEFLFLLDQEQNKEVEVQTNSDTDVEKKPGKTLLIPLKRPEPSSGVSGSPDANLSFTLGPSKLSSLRSFAGPADSSNKNVSSQASSSMALMGLSEVAVRELLDRYRDKEKLSPASVKSILRTFGVNMKFIGQVLARLELRLQQHDDGCAKEAAKGMTTFVTPPVTQRATSRGERFASAAFLKAHPVAKAVRLELVSRCARVAFHHWQRKQALTHHFVDLATLEKLRGSQSSYNTSLTGALMEKCKKEITAKTVDFMFRVSGDCLSFQDDSDQKMWTDLLIPISKLMFGYELAFVREQVSTSTVSSFSGHDLGLSTGSRVRLRPMQQPHQQHADDNAVPRPINITRVDFTPWGTVDDERLRLPVATNFVTTHTSPSTGANPSGTRSAVAPPSDLGDFIVCSTSRNGEPPSVRSEGKKGPRAPSDVRLGAKQDYRLVERLCELVNVKLVRSAAHDFTGVWAEVAPRVNLLETKCPLSPEALFSVHNGLSQQCERKMLDELKEKRKLLSPGAPEAPLIGYYYRLVILYMMTARAVLAVDCCKKMRDAQVRDIGNNELGVVMTTLLEARCEMDRKRFTDAVEQGNHALTLAQQFANNSQVVAAAMLAILDGIDALGAPTFALRTKKADISAQLVPLCAKFGLAVGRVKAREALSRITADKASAQQLLPLGQAVKSVLAEQGLDAESASMSVRFILLSESIRALPTAVKAVEHCIPLNSTLFRPSMNGLLDFCYAQLASRMADIPPNSVTLEDLWSFLEVRLDTVIPPSLALYNLEIQTLHLTEAMRIKLSEDISRSTYIEGRVLSFSEELGLILSCTLYTFKFWVTSILRSVPAEKRPMFSLWDAQTVTRFADSVNAARAFSQIHPLVSVKLNHMLLSLLHLELGGDDVLGPRHATVPIAISWAYDLMCTAHRIVLAEIQRRGFAQARQRSAHLIELPPSKEDQLDTLKEVMVPVDLGLEVLETLRHLHNFLVSSAEHKTIADGNTFPQLFSAEKVVDDTGQADGSTSTVKSVCAQSNMIPLVADVFTASFCGCFAKNGTTELDELLRLCKSYFTGELVGLVTDIGRRYKLQKVALWTHFLTIFAGLYDAESQIFTPVHNPKTPVRTEAQLTEMIKTLTLLTNLASTNIGAIENQHMYEQMLASLSMRTAASRRLPHGAAIGASSNSNNNASQMVTIVTPSSPAVTEDKRTALSSQTPTVGASFHQSPHLKPPAGGLGPNASLSNISAVLSTESSRRVESTEPKRETGAYSKLWDRIRAEDSAKEPFFRVSPSSGVQGSDVTVEWQLPPMAPPRYGCIGIFPDDGGALVQSQALDLRTGLQYRQVAGRVENFSLPSKPGVYVIALFTTGHSEGLPFSPQFVARIRSLPGERTAQKHEHSEQRSRRTPSPVVVALPPVGYSPCDTKKSQVDRITALAQKDAVMRRSLGLPPAQYDISSAISPPGDVLQEQRKSYEKNIRPARYANVAKGVECVVLFSSTDRKKQAAPL